MMRHNFLQYGKNHEGCGDRVLTTFAQNLAKIMRFLPKISDFSLKTADFALNLEPITDDVNRIS